MTGHELVAHDVKEGVILEECLMDWNFHCDPERIPEDWVCNRGAEYCPAAIPKPKED